MPSAKAKPPARSKRSGLTLIEIMVALALLGIIGLIAGGFLLPLRLTRTSNVETQALSLARSYLELVKNRWQALPDYCNTGDDLTGTLQAPQGWSIQSNKADWKKPDTLRTVKVTVTPTGSPAVQLSTRIMRPSDDACNP